MVSIKYDTNSKVKDRQKWLARPQNKQLLCDAEIEDIISVIEKKPSTLAPNIASSLAGLSTWYFQNGIEKIAQKSRDGWNEIHKASSYYIWHNKILVHLVELDNRTDRPLRITPRNYCLALIFALWIDDQKNAVFLGSRLSAWLASKNYFKNSSYLKSGFAHFTCRLFQTWTNRSLSKGPEDIDANRLYERIFEHWTDLRILEKDIIKACDFHIERTSQQSDRDIPEFESTPHDLIPVDYLALKKVRKDLGYDTPKPKHPLLDTPFADPPNPLPPFEDKLFDQAIAAVREQHPEL